jgi:MarR family transcriptional regulator for hemolysin
MAESEHRGVGNRLWATSQLVGRAFDRDLAEAGGSRPVWFILMTLHDDDPPLTQRELAARIDLREATVTHHLNAMSEAGLIERLRSDENRRVVRVALTPAGHELFDRLLEAALRFDKRLQVALGDQAPAFLHALGELRDEVGRSRGSVN